MNAEQVASSKIAIIGTGQLGTALASVIGKNINYKTWLYSIDNEIVNSINEHCHNSKYFSSYNINAKATNNFNQAIEKADIIFLTVPSFAVNEIIQKISLTNNLANIVICSKGFNDFSDNMGDLIFSDCIKKILPNNNIFVFSGPSFADGIIDGISTCVSLATENIENCGPILDCFAHSNITLYPTTDLTGVQILGAVKGAIAIKIGILEAIRNKLCIAQNSNPDIYNNKMYKTLSEIIMEVRQMVIALGGQDATISSPAGIGDIMMVCNSEQSRNKRFGIEIGNILWVRMLDIENNDFNKIRINFLIGNIDTNLPISEIKKALILANKTVEGYFALPKIAKILKNIQINAPHLEWVCDIFK